MDKVLIVANGTKQASYPLSAEMKEYLEGKAIQTEIIYTDQSDEPLMVPFDVDLVITLGGDGTVLAAARAVCTRRLRLRPEGRSDGARCRCRCR